MSVDRKRQLPLLLGAAVFLVGGFGSLQDGALLVGWANLVAGLLNLVALPLVKASPRFTAVTLNLLNAGIAGLMVLSSVQAGKHYIQYAWVAALLMFVGAALASLKASRPAGQGDAG